MDINELFEEIAEAFRQYQVEMTEQEKTSTNPTPAGLESKWKPEKNRENNADRERSWTRFPEMGVIAGRLAECSIRHKPLNYTNKKKPIPRAGLGNRIGLSKC